MRSVLLVYIRYFIIQLRLFKFFSFKIGSSTHSLFRVTFCIFKSFLFFYIKIVHINQPIGSFCIPVANTILDKYYLGTCLYIILVDAFTNHFNLQIINEHIIMTRMHCICIYNVLFITQLLFSKHILYASSPVFYNAFICKI